MSSIDFLSLIDMCMSTNVRKLSRIITRIYDLHLKPSGLNINKLAILLTIKGLSDSNDSNPTVGEIADRMAMEKSTLSRNLRVLENQDYIDLKMSSSNRSRKEVQVTKVGMDTILDAYTYWEEVQSKIKNGIGEKKFYDTIVQLNEIENFLVENFELSE